MIFSQVVPSKWKKGNIVSIHERNDQQNLINYFPVSLLPISDKFFDTLNFDKTCRIFFESKLIKPHQSGFKPGYSCRNQLLSIIHEVYKSFDDGLEIRSVFLDVTKAFDKVWQVEVILKLEQNGISG